MFRDTFPYFTLSRIDRSYAKPRGHAGDYLTIEMLYNNQAGGDRRLGPYIDRWALDLPASHAVKNRRRLLTDVIMGVAAENPGPWYGALERLVTPRSVTRSKRRPGETPLGVHQGGHLDQGDDRPPARRGRCRPSDRDRARDRRTQRRAHLHRGMSDQPTPLGYRRLHPRSALPPAARPRGRPPPAAATTAGCGVHRSSITTPVHLVLGCDRQSLR
jgi:hypothetical protein